MQVLRGNNLPLRSCKLLLLLRQFRVGNQQQNAMRLVGQDAAWVVEGNFRPGRIKKKGNNSTFKKLSCLLFFLM